MDHRIEHEEPEACGQAAAEFAAISGKHLQKNDNVINYKWPIRGNVRIALRTEKGNVKISLSLNRNGLSNVRIAFD